jgi:ribosome-binding protein aMBF1 (putative translation factor)
MMETTSKRNGVTTVGRKREGQPKNVRGTPAGKFGQHLEALMIRAGMTTSELADRIEATPDAVRKYLRGTHTPAIDKWPRIARVLGLKNAKDLVPDIPAE